MKILKKILIILIIATTIFTVVECNRTEDEDNIKQELDNNVLLEEDKEDAGEQDEPEEQEKEEIEYPVELG